MPVAPSSVVTLPNGNIPGSAPGVVAAVRSHMPHTQEKDLPGPWVVQKFGGTSIGKFAETIARDVIGAAIARNRIAVVCSARSSHTKSEGTTNRLLRAAREAEKPKSRQYIAVVNTIQDDHLNAARASIKSGEILSDLIYDIKAECAGLIKILESAQHLEEVSSRAEDKIVSKGEKLSCMFMKALLEDHGIQANYIDIADLVPPPPSSNGSYNATQRLDDSFYMDIAKTLGEKILASGRGVPVITGYFGNVPGGLLNNLGRGYTDLCAALVAVGLQASELQIWKEVDGIFTADPRKVPTARLLETVTPAEAAELTFYGSEVIHPFTMQQVIRNRIPIRVKNVMNPRCAGTVIYPDKDHVDVEDEDLYATAAMKFTKREPGSMIPGQRPKRPTAITVKHHIVILNVHSNKRTRAHGFLMNIFRVLDKWHLSVDLISSSEVHVSLALHSESALLSGGGEDELKIQDESLEGAVRDLREFGAVDLMNNMAIVSLVGKQLKNMVGISGKFFSTLGKNNINIEMISQGASEINISCVVEEREADRALNVVHTSLFTFLES